LNFSAACQGVIPTPLWCQSVTRHAPRDAWAALVKLPRDKVAGINLYTNISIGIGQGFLRSDDGDGHGAQGAIVRRKDIAGGELWPLAGRRARGGVISFLVKNLGGALRVTDRPFVDSPYRLSPATRLGEPLHDLRELLFVERFERRGPDVALGTQRQQEA